MLRQHGSPMQTVSWQYPVGFSSSKTGKGMQRTSADCPLPLHRPLQTKVEWFLLLNSSLLFSESLKHMTPRPKGTKMTGSPESQSDYR